MAYLFKYYAKYYDQFMKSFKLDSTEAILKNLGDIKRKRILDLGGGTGTLADQLQRAGADVTIIDPSAEMTRIAKEKNPKLKIYNATLQDLGDLHLEKQFDIVIIRDTLHHIRGQQDTIKEVARCLNQKGILLIAEFNLKSIKTKCIWCLETLCFERCRMFTKERLLTLCSPYFKKQQVIAISEFEMLYKGEIQ